MMQVVQNENLEVQRFNQILLQSDRTQHSYKSSGNDSELIILPA